MLKFHHRLLLLLSTITIISFIGLGAILHHTIYQILSTTQSAELNHISENFIKLNNQKDNKEITNVASDRHLTVYIYKDGNNIYKLGNHQKF